MEQQKLASLWSRVGGAFIDLIFVLLFVGVIMLVWGFLIGINGSELYLTKSESEALWSARGFLTGLIVDFIYNVMLMGGNKQSTYGQRAVGIKIIKDSGGPVGYATAIGRWIVSGFSSILLKIGFLIAIFTKNKKTLHDFIAGTIVVESEQESQPKINDTEPNLKSTSRNYQKSTVHESMEDAYGKAAEVRAFLQQNANVIDKEKNVNLPSSRRIETMEDAYAQTVQEKLVEEKSNPQSVDIKNNLDEGKIWEMVAEEFESDLRKKGLYAKLFTEQNGDEVKARIAYYKIRVEEIKHNM